MEIALLLGGAFVAVFLWQWFAAGSGQPARTPSDTFGNARFADFAHDGPALRSILAAGKNTGAFLGYASERAEGTGWDHILRYDGPRHLVTVAPNRSGKGTCAILPTLATDFSDSVICIDPKGQNAAVVKRWRSEVVAVHLLNPFNEHGMGTSQFNPLAHLSIDNPNVVADVAGLAEALIISDEKDSHWTDSARTLVRVLLLHLVATKGEAASLPEMRRLLTQDAKAFDATVFEMLKSPYGFIAQPAAQFEKESKEVDSIISTARTQTAFLDDPAIAHVLARSDFAMLDLKEQQTAVFVILPSRFLIAYARFFRLIVVAALDQLQSRAGGTFKTLFILDEFAALGHLSAIETAFGQAAGFKVQLWPFLQDLNQLKSIYKDRWESFLANAGVIQWFTPNDMFTAEYISKRAGNKTVITRSTSTGTSTREGSGVTSSESTGETGVPLMSPADLFGMSGTRQLLMLNGISNPLLAWKFPYYFDPENLDQPGVKFQKDNFALYDQDPFHG